MGVCSIVSPRPGRGSLDNGLSLSVSAVTVRRVHVSSPGWMAGLKIPIKTLSNFFQLNPALPRYKVAKSDTWFNNPRCAKLGTCASGSSNHFARRSGRAPGMLW